jgi:hypothetical protein
MITPDQCHEKFGIPETESSMILWDVPPALEIGVLPNRLYCNKLMIQPLSRAFGNLIERGHFHELKTFDGCFQIRKQRGTRSTPSIHSWGLAIDVNATWNGLGKKPTLSAGFVSCFTDAGFDWGGTWRRTDGMHFQLAKIV